MTSMLRRATRLSPRSRRPAARRLRSMAAFRSPALRSFRRRRRGEVRWPRHHRQQRRLHLGFDDPEDDRRAVPGHARCASVAPFRILRAAAEPIRIFARKEAEAGQEVFRKVVNISSIAGLYGNAGQASYSSAKASLIGLTRTMCKEWGRYKVNVNCVAFGLINTRLTQPIEASKRPSMSRARYQGRRPAADARQHGQNDSARSRGHAGRSRRCGLSVLQPGIELHQWAGGGLRRRHPDLRCRCRPVPTPTRNHSFCCEAIAP